MQLLEFIRKKKYNITTALSIVVVIIISVIFIVIKKQNNISWQLAEHGAGLSETEKFVIKESFNDTLVAERNGEIIKVKIVKNYSEEKAKKYIDEQSALLKGIFEPQLPPYPEFLTKESVCADKYKPIRYKNKFGQYFILYAGDRLGYGVCVDDLIHYKASLGFFYCPNKNTLFTIEYFVSDKEDFNKIINLNNSFACR